MEKQTVATTLVEALRDIGVKHVFGVPSGGWIDYMEALRKTEGIDFVLATHEGGAAMMAEVSGRLTGLPGVCFGTFGPGATNLTTGVGEALLDRSPLIALTDEMPAAMRGRTVQMGIDHQALFAPLTKMTSRLRADSVRSLLFEAASVALNRRPGPVHIGLPVGLSAEIAAVEPIDFCLPVHQQPAATALLELAGSFLKESRRPMLAVGLGAIKTGARDDIIALAHKQQMPVVLTPMAKGMISEDDPSYSGVVFHALSNMVGETHQQADVVFAIGYDPVEFNYESWLNPAAQLVSLDIEPADIDRTTYKVVDVVGNIAASVNYLLTMPAIDNAWDMAGIRARTNAIFARLSPTNGRFGPIAALSILRDLLPETGIMTCDVGAHTHLIGQFWRTPAPGLQIMTNGWSTMGFGIPAAIAAKLARPEQSVCAVVGDGGFLMTVGELATAVRLNLKIVILVLTDNDLALIRIKQEKKGHPIYGTPVRELGTIGGPSIFGVPVRVARDPGELVMELKAAFASDGPVIVEALVDSREYDSIVLKKDKP